MPHSSILTSPGHLQVLHRSNVYIMRHIFTSRKDLAICSFTTFFTFSHVSNCMSSWPYQTSSISDIAHMIAGKALNVHVLIRAEFDNP